MNSTSPLLRKPGKRPRVGTLIRNLRRRQDQTLQELGDQAGLSVGFLNQVEREIATPSLSALAQIAQAPGVDIEYFVASPSSDSTSTCSGEREIYWVDSLHFRSSRKHSWSNPTGTASKISWTGTAHILRRKFKPFLAKV